MTDPTPAAKQPRSRRIARGIGVGLLSVAVFLLAAVILGALAPNIPLVGVVGSAISGTAPWIGVALVLLLAITVWLIIRRRGIWRIVIASVAALALVGSVVITSQLVRVGSDNGVSLNPFAASPASRDADHTEQYASHNGEPLEVSIWSPSDNAEGNAPVAFFTHGGGWVSGDPALDLAGMFTTLSDEGWLVVSAQYTLASPTVHTSDIVEAQVGCAMAWTAANAASYGGDPATFISMGESAGGNLAINAAYRTNSGDLTCEGSGEMPAVDAVVTLFPGVNPYGLYADPIAGGAVPGRTFMDQYIGGSPEDFPQQYEAVNSSTHIDSSSPPTLIFQGENDHLVQAPRVYDFVDDAESAGVDVALVKVPFGEHGFPLLPLGAQLYNQVTMEWLKSQGFTP
jgi:acetyl esterase